MKEKVSNKYISSILYAISAGFLGLYIYCAISAVSPFLRAGVLLAVCVFMYAGVYQSAKHQDTEIARKRVKTAFFLMLLLYVSMLVTFLFFDGYFGRDLALTEMGLGEYLQTSANFVPFKSTSSLIYGYCRGWISFSKPLLNIGGNLVAFMPFALFLPLLFKKLSKAVPFLVSVACMVTVVEVTQLVLRRGVCDVDDLILNVGGAGLMLIILHTKLVRKMIGKLTFDLY